MKCGGQLFSTTVVPPRLLCHRRTCQWWDNKGVCSPWLFFFFSCLGRYGWGTQSVSASLPYPPVVWPQLLSRRTATGPGVVHAPVHHCFCSTFSVSPRYLALLCNLSQKLQKKKKKKKSFRWQQKRDEEIRKVEFRVPHRVKKEICSLKFFHFSLQINPFVCEDVYVYEPTHTWVEARTNSWPPEDLTSTRALVFLLRGPQFTASNAAEWIYK